MYFFKRHPWVTAYLIAIVFFAWALIAGRESIDAFYYYFTLSVALIGYLILLLPTWVIIWRGRRASAGRSFLTMLRASFLLFLVVMGWRVWLTTHPTRVQHAKDFADMTAPLLERYYDNHHRYPRSLSELSLPEPIPWGLYYSANDGPNEWPSVSHLGESYTMLFGDLWYRGDKDWEFGGL